MEVFVYGTLADPDTAADVLDGFDYRGAAELSGLHRVDGTYPTLAPGGSVTGRILSTDDVAALDRYEGVDRGLYVRVTVPVADHESTTDPGRLTDGGVQVYVGDPERLDVPVAWPGEGGFPDCVRTYVANNDVVVRPSGPDG